MYFDKMQHFGLEQMPSEGGAIISVYSSSAVKEATLRMTKNDCVRVARQKQSITPWIHNHNFASPLAIN